MLRVLILEKAWLLILSSFLYSFIILLNNISLNEKILSKYLDKLFIDDLLKDLLRFKYSIYGDLYILEFLDVILKSPKSSPSLPFTLFGK